MPKRYPNKEFRKLVQYANEARENKRIKFYENKEPKEINFHRGHFSPFSSVEYFRLPKI